MATILTTKGVKYAVITGISCASIYHGSMVYTANKKYDKTSFDNVSSFTQGAFTGAYMGMIAIVLSPVLIPVIMVDFIVKKYK